MAKDDSAGTKPAEAKAPNPNLLAGAMIFGAVLTAVIGTAVPALAEMTGPEATWIPFVFYAIAALEVILAMWLRARLIKALGAARPGAGTVQRR